MNENDNKNHDSKKKEWWWKSIQHLWKRIYANFISHSFCNLQAMKKILQIQYREMKKNETWRRNKIKEKKKRHSSVANFKDLLEWGLWEEPNLFRILNIFKLQIFVIQSGSYFFDDFYGKVGDDGVLAGILGNQTFFEVILTFWIWIKLN